MKKRTKILLGVVAVAIVAFLAMGVYSFLSFRVVRFSAGSMANTIIPGESILCSLTIDEVRRGDIVWFKLPTDPKVTYMKRVIGLPGDRIQVQGMKVFINGQELPEARTIIELDPYKDTAHEELSIDSSDGPYRVYYTKRDERKAYDSELSSGMQYGAMEEFQIPYGHYFVMGDCRDNSLDSRYWGTVPRENIIGKALKIVVSNDSKRIYQTLK